MQDPISPKHIEFGFLWPNFHQSLAKCNVGVCHTPVYTDNLCAKLCKYRNACVRILSKRTLFLHRLPVLLLLLSSCTLPPLYHILSSGFQLVQPIPDPAEPCCNTHSTLHKGLDPVHNLVGNCPVREHTCAVFFFRTEV
ncbi:hypothetical protein Q5P01_019131 [Channa striata]|uniref:Uncharacterized protein n=1 Tax=Channa striata TaxID=64152 RepID=A0AA88M0Q8_CHASR|nr:hypothetical protein Q5P01_019131 [Channa striata]